MSGVAIVTGAARGIGAATVRELVARDWQVLAVDVAADDPALPYPLGTTGQLTALAEERPDRIATAVADVRDIDALRGVVATTEERFGGLDAAIAVAGVMAGGVPQWELGPEQERAVLDVNLGGVANLARAAVPALLRRPAPRHARFLAVASGAATEGLPMLAAYCAAKAGVAGLVRALAVELAPHGITANAVSPGSTDTDILTETARLYGVTTEQLASQQPAQRLLEPAEIARVLAFLAGPESSGMTGAVVPVDGGMSL